MRNRPNVNLNDLHKDVLTTLISHFGLKDLISLTAVDKKLNKFQKELIITRLNLERDKLQRALKNDLPKFSDMANEAIEHKYVHLLYYSNPENDNALNDDERKFNNELQKQEDNYKEMQKIKEAKRLKENVTRAKSFANQMSKDVDSVIGKNYIPQQSYLFSNSSFDSLYELKQLCLKLNAKPDEQCLAFFSEIKTKLMSLAASNEDQNLTFFYDYSITQFLGDKAFDKAWTERNNFLKELKNQMKQYPSDAKLPGKIGELKDILVEYTPAFTTNINIFKTFESCAKVISSRGFIDSVKGNDHFKQLAQDLKSSVDTIHQQTPPPLPPRKKR